MPSIVQLERFVAVAEELNFRKAAMRLHMSQPPLSDTIRQLEDELGITLLSRTRRSVSLTKSGRVFLERAYRILSQLDEAVDVSRAVAHGMSGHLAIGFCPTATYGVLPRVLRRFTQSYPDVSLKFDELATAEQEDALLQKRVDVGLFHAPAVNRGGVLQETVISEPMLIALPGDHPLARHNKIEIAELKRESFILVPPRWGTGFHARVSHACQQAGFAPHVMQEVDRVHTMVSLVAAGMGIAFCAASQSSFAPDGVTFRQLDDPLGLFRVEFGVSWRETDQAPITLAFRDVARELRDTAQGAPGA